MKERYQLNCFICIKDFNAETIASLKLNCFLSLFAAVSIMKGKRSAFIYFWYQTDSGVPNTSIYPAVSLASPYYNYLKSSASTTIICWRCHSNSVNTGSRLAYLSDVKTRKRRTWSELIWFETTVLETFNNIDTNILRSSSLLAYPLRNICVTICSLVVLTIPLSLFHDSSLEF